LPLVEVSQSPQAVFKAPVPAHWTLHAASGKSIVIEYVGGKLQITDKPTGVMTNAAEFGWHLNNVANYPGPNPKPAAPMKVFGADGAAVSEIHDHFGPL
jgi:choloylglycine hydrolase